LLSYELRDDAAVAAWVRAGDLVACTEHTLTTASALTEELALIRERGYSTDAQENQPGINCLAVPVFLESPRTPSGAISVSALAYRTPLSALIDALPAILATVTPRSVSVG
jgi:IclR family acetate operon transcriptional repressor